VFQIEDLRRTDVVWLWIEDLTSRGVNDWMEVTTYDRTKRCQLTAEVIPGRLRPYVMEWMVKAGQKEVILALAPQTEFHYFASVLDAVSSSALDDDRMSLGMSYASLRVIYSGEP
jgi:hypothetical protein